MGLYQDLEAKLGHWRADPVYFVRDCFGAEPDDWQAEALMAFKKHERCAVKSCKGPGKTTWEAWCAWNFLATRPHPRIAATSITAPNLRDNLWAEMSKWQQRSEFLKHFFQWGAQRIFCKQHPASWWMSARPFSRQADPQAQADTLAGLHEDYCMYIMDEAGGLPDGVAAAAEGGLATGIETKLIIAGNPTNLSGPLWRACTKERKLWWVWEITGDPDDPKRSSRVKKEWAQQQIDKYGRNNPYVLVNVFGRFPPTGFNMLLGPDEVNAACGRHLRADVYDTAQKRLGVDVARFGDDSTVIFPRQGLASFVPVVMRGARTHEIAARVINNKTTWGSEMEFVDDTGGYGAGVIDSMIQGGYNPVAVCASGKPGDARFSNKRTEVWWKMKEWVQRGAALPNDPELVEDLTNITYTFINGKFQLEAKEHVKARTGRSPDKADALAQTFAIPEMPSGVVDGIPIPQKPAETEHEWDPLDPSRV